MAPADNFFYTGAILLIFVKKCKKNIGYVQCAMRKFWRTLSRPFGPVEQCGNPLRIEIPGEGCTLVCPG